MITFVCKNGDTAVLRVISCKESRMASAVNGSDVVNLDEVMNSINGDDDVKHINLAVTYYEDEKEILEFINSHNSPNWRKYPSNGSNNNNQKKPQKEEEDCCDETKHSWICPVCGEETGLVDKNGKTYPCYSCLQIDIGQRLERKYMDQIKQLLAKNTFVLDRFNDIIEAEINKVAEQKKPVKKESKKNG